jgi:ATP-dependent DNA ligase
MPQIIEPDGRQPCPAQQLPEGPVRKVVGLGDAARGGGEDEPLVLILLAHKQLPLGLRDAVPLERSHRPVADRDGAVLARLGRAENVLPPVATADCPLDADSGDPAWLFEPKYDGFRGMVYIRRKDCVIRSKRGNVFSRFRELGPAICGQLRAREVILDGEILALDDDGRPIFRHLLRSGAGRLAYAVFDLLWVNGRDLRGLSLTKRRARLGRVLPEDGPTVFKVLTVEECGIELFQAVQQLDFEGIIAKRKADPYGPKTAWYKIKNPAYTQAEGRGEMFERRA